MKTCRLVATLVFWASASAQAAPMDAKGLARFDLGYAKCEQMFEYMRGHVDEAYLGLWKLKSDNKSRAKLAALRTQPAYQAEKRTALKAMDKPTPEIQGKLNQQCQATWAQAGVAPAAAKP